MGSSSVTPEARGWHDERAGLHKPRNAGGQKVKKKGRKKDTERDFPLEFLEVACLADTFNPVNLTLDFWLPGL